RRSAGPTFVVVPIAPSIPDDDQPEGTGRPNQETDRQEQRPEAEHAVQHVPDAAPHQETCDQEAEDGPRDLRPSPAAPSAGPSGRGAASITIPARPTPSGDSGGRRAAPVVRTAPRSRGRLLPRVRAARDGHARPRRRMAVAGRGGFGPGLADGAD